MAKIMLVEDDNNLREIYEARLLAEGYEIVTARDGEEALAVAVKERPDLVISDVMMPKISGFDMLDILRSTPETKNVKVIMMTALSQAEDKDRATKLGADRYLVKSQVTLEDVAKVAREVLEGPQAPVTASTTGSEPAAAAAPAATTDLTSTPAAPTADSPAEPAAPTTPVIADPAPAAAAPAATTDLTSAPVTPTEPAAVDIPTVPVVASVPTSEEPQVDTSSLVTDSVAVATPPPPITTPAAVDVSVTAGVTDLNSTDPAVSTPVAAEPATGGIPDIERPSAEVWAIPAEDSAPADSTSDPSQDSKVAVATALASVEATSSQTLAEEEAAIAKQIESIIDTNAQEPAAAVDTSVSTTPAPDTQAVPAATPTPAEDTSVKAPSAGQKVIQPLTPPVANGPDLHEQAKNETDAAAHPTGAVVHPESAPPAAPAPAADGAVDPNSLAL